MRTQRPSLGALSAVGRKLPRVLQALSPTPSFFSLPSIARAGTGNPLPAAGGPAWAACLLLRQVCNYYANVFQFSRDTAVHISNLYPAVPQEQWKRKRTAHLTFEDWSQGKIFFLSFFIEYELDHWSLFLGVDVWIIQTQPS